MIVGKTYQDREKSIVNDNRTKINRFRDSCAIRQNILIGSNEF